jgi:hypothetical protein
MIIIFRLVSPDFKIIPQLEFRFSDIVDAEHILIENEMFTRANTGGYFEIS